MPKIPKLKIEHIPLHCPLCEKRFMNILGQPLPNHSQIRCNTSEGNEMDLGICTACVDVGVSLDTCQAILEGIKDYWIYEIDGNKQMNENEKNRRKQFHGSHVISEVIKIVNTGKEAENKARKKGHLK
jgi:hypothetical protein